MKDIRKLLSQQSAQILPDSDLQNKIKQDLGIHEPPKAQIIAQDGTAAATHPLKRMYWVWIALAVVLVVAFVSVGIVWMNSNKGGGILIDNKFQGIESAEDFFAYGATSVGALLDTDSPVGARVQAASDDEDADWTNAQIDTVNGYMLLIEQLLSQGEIAHTEQTPTDPDYAYAMQVTFRDLLGNTMSYTLAYNRTPMQNGKAERIQGVLQLDGARYAVEGLFESEHEGEEYEEEMWFRVYLDETMERYLVVELETETESEIGMTEQEQEYSYTLYESGKQVSKTVISYEKEGSETELELSIRQGNQRTQLSFEEKQRRGTRYLEVEGVIDGQKVACEIEIVSGSGESYYRYRFGNGHSTDRPRKG